MLKKTISERLFEGSRKICDCFVWTGHKNKKGYGLIWDQDRRKQITTHRVAWEIANGPIPEGICVLHHCDNPSCVRSDHLFLGTNLDNVKDKMAKGRQQRLKGETNPFSKLTDEIIVQARTMYSRGDISYREIGEHFGVSLWTIGMAIRKKTWGHVGIN